MLRKEMNSMKALVKYAKGDGYTEIKEMPKPVLSAGEVLIQVKYVGICGSDIHIYHDNVSYQINYPIILGHEFAGIIEEITPQVKDFKIGDRVTVETHAQYCGKCLMCRNNNYHLCKERKGYGLQVNGAFAKYIKAKEQILHHIPENITLKEAALTEPLCVAFNLMVKNLALQPGDIVMIIGPGPIGLFCTQIAKIAGASEIIVVGSHGDQKRLSKAQKLGATTTFDINKEDPLVYIKRKNEGYGADLVIDAAGPAETLKLALEAVRPCGVIGKVAWGPEPIHFSLDKLLEKSLTLRGTFSHTWDVWEKSLKLMAKKQVDLNALITHELPIEEWKKGFDLIESKDAIKVILVP